MHIDWQNFWSAHFVTKEMFSSPNIFNDLESRSLPGESTEVESDGWNHLWSRTSQEKIERIFQEFWRCHLDGLFSGSHGKVINRRFVLTDIFWFNQQRNSGNRLLLYMRDKRIYQGEKMTGETQL